MQTCQSVHLPLAKRMSRPSRDRRRGILDNVPVDIEDDFDAWAWWIKTYREGPGLGGGSIIWRMMQAKKLGIMAYGTGREPVMPERLEQVDDGVCTLERREQKAFCTHYLQYAQASDKARWCHCSVAEYYRRLKRARRTVADFVRNARI